MRKARGLVSFPNILARSAERYARSFEKIVESFLICSAEPRGLCGDSIRQDGEILCRPSAAAFAVAALFHRRARESTRRDDHHPPRPCCRFNEKLSIAGRASLRIKLLEHPKVVLAELAARLQAHELAAEVREK
jgi:hypothetical protein